MASKLGFDDTMVFKVDTVDLDKPIELGSDDGTQYLIDLLETLEAKKEAEKLSGWVRWFIPGTPYGIENLPKHHAFFAASKDHSETYFSMANRGGKTIAGALKTACHLLGDYPDWWPGRKFEKPTDGWAVGDNKETVRDIMQKELLGDVGKIGTGMLPADRILKVVYRPNSGGAVDYVLVKHSTGGTSRLGFKSSEQGMVSFYGTAKDFIWLDELPPADIYSECFLRTMTTNGIIYVTATPLAGLTPLVLSFYNNADFLPEGSELPGIVRLSREDEEEALKDKLKKGEIDSLKKAPTSKAVVIGGWDDAPWLTEDAKRRMLDATPSHLREARSKGLPSMGSGTIFTVPLEEVLVKDFEIPRHWKKIAGKDVGWNNTAAIWLAENPDTKEVFAYSEYKRGQAEPLVHAAAIKSRGDWIPIAIDPASRGRSQVDGKQLFNLYRDLGVKLFPADNAVEAGIYTVQEMLATGRLKFFRSLSELSKEYVVYRRDQKGRVIKENDHCLTGDTLVQTDAGNKKIVDLVGTEGNVRTLSGKFVPYKNCRLTKKDAELVEVVFEGGYVLRCTPDHKLLTESGWIEAIDSFGYYVYNVGSNPKKEQACLSSLSSTGSREPSKSFSGSGIISAEITSNVTVSDFTAQSGRTSMEKSRKVTTSTTSTTTKPTTLQKILSWFTALSTCLTTKPGTVVPFLKRRTMPQQSGTDQKKVGSGTLHTTSDTSICSTQGSSDSALTAESLTKQAGSITKHRSAQTTANLPTDEQPEQITLSVYAQTAPRLSPLTNTQSSIVARDCVALRLRVVNVRRLNYKADVFCLEVPDFECFAIGNGAVVHNCLDALRYAVMGLKHAKQPPISRQGGQSLNGSGRRYDI